MNASEFIQITLTGLPQDDSTRELVMSGMLEIGFDSFWEDGALLHAYIAADSYKTETLQLLIEKMLPNSPVRIIQSELENKNWNEEWEKNFPSTEIEGQIYVSAPFHPQRPEIPYQIRIIPKMSFGTAQHATTYSMLRLMIEMDFENKTVIDAGTGTGILAIFAELKNAASVFAYDNDDWSVENSIENIERNNCRRIEISKGEKEILSGRTCDILLANIHKNVILGNLPFYNNALKAGGNLLLSGFYSEDLPDISDACEALGMEIEKFIVKENWVAARFTKVK
ncbi:MAG: hypothetical protein A2W93_04035 [Bacteroidetes bacterium GWF2_43_63]|nr:MAG: hypothetical protein A2W94_06180 [Bacteroidetes bacterium GWE2_42_42]OFY54352.1 MAG: hypothetical protein A2W93_04035 [Bacteroidetes bacterium GWF2_43_63]HBG69259.1 50S ribosomal protein L11 methyltransferase [Bacteroidales bacterium]HCB61185.1 50S ribosomal protein L11 methyltransferase [Bacteroidales bacterium]HCY24105.1 50S ribosomal protein L11 methyltransferase [Bacteroidales bacterium]